MGASMIPQDAGGSGYYQRPAQYQQGGYAPYGQSPGAGPPNTSAPPNASPGLAPGGRPPRRMGPPQQQQQQQGQQPPQQPQTFAQLQSQGVARPAPPPAPSPAQGAPSFQYSRSPVNGQLQSSVMGMLQNPSSYDDAAVQREYSTLGGQIDDEYTQNQNALEQDMAQRGLTDSSIRGGKLADLNVEKRSAKVQLADSLATKQAEALSTARAQAVAAATQYQGQQQSADVAGYGANLSGLNYGLQQQLGLGNLGVQQGQLGVQQGQLAQQGQQFQQQFGLDQLKNAQDFQLGQGQLGVAQQGANTQAQSVSNQYQLGQGQLGLDTNKLNEDARQFDSSNYLQGVLGLGDLDLRQASLTTQDNQFAANLGLQAQQFGAQDYRQSQQLGLQDQAQRIALAQSGTSILAQLASTPGLSAIMYDKNGALTPQGKQILDSVQNVTGSSAQKPTAIDGQNPYLSSAFSYMSGFNPLPYQSPLSQWTPSWRGENGQTPPGVGTPGSGQPRYGTPGTYGGQTFSTGSGFNNNGNNPVSPSGLRPQPLTPPTNPTNADGTPQLTGGVGQAQSAFPWGDALPSDPSMQFSNYNGYTSGNQAYLNAASAFYGINPGGGRLPGPRPASIKYTGPSNGQPVMNQNGVYEATPQSLAEQDAWYMPQQAGYNYNQYTGQWEDPNSSESQARDDAVMQYVRDKFGDRINAGNITQDEWSAARQEALANFYGGAPTHSLTGTQARGVGGNKLGLY